ncbi:DUF2793 domain-containing protein [bacterium]|nr:DUF2793 domain-containing protein [bacterium]
MTNSTNLSLPYVAAGQAQKHVTVNESLRRLDAVVQLGVVSATTTAQPASPADGAVYILPAGKTGAAWGAMSVGALAYWRDGAWEAITPREGWLAWTKDVDGLLVFDGAAWTTSGLRTALGLGTAATKNTGASGATVPLLDAANTWGAIQTVNFAAGHPAAFYMDPFYYVQLVTRAATNGGVGFAMFANDAGGAQRSVYVAATPDGDLTITPQSGRGVYSAGLLSPSADNAYSLGAGSTRWSVVYVATGAINTSDAREKTGLRPLSGAERRAARRILGGVGAFQWRDAVSRKGDDPAKDGARLHIGVTAQAVADAFAAEGLDPAHYALWCADPVFDEVEIEPARMIDLDLPDGTRRQVPAPPRTERRPRLEADGTQAVRFGVRHDQLFAMALAVIFSEERPPA